MPRCSTSSADIQFARHNYRSAIDHYDRVLEYGFLDGAAETACGSGGEPVITTLSEYPNAEKEH